MAQYRVGTVSVTNGSNTVVGTGTAFSSNVVAGKDWFLIQTGQNGSGVTYQISSVVNDTNLTLSAPWGGSTASGLFYVITNSYTPNRNYPVAQPGDIESLAIIARAEYMMDTDVATVLGGAGGGGTVTPTTTLTALTDVENVGNSGDILAKDTNGKYHFVTPNYVSAFANGSTGTGLFMSITSGSAAFKSLVAGTNVTFSVNADNIVINAAGTGEINTLSNQGGTSAKSLVGNKVGTALGIKGIQAGSNVTITDDGNELVISSTAAGGTGGSGTITGASNLGGSAGAVGLFASTSGATLQFYGVKGTGKISATADTVNGLVSLGFAGIALSEVGGVTTTGASTGQVLTWQANGTASFQALPSASATSLVTDSNPTLSADLQTQGRKIVGLIEDWHVPIPKPAAGTITLILYSSVARNVTAVRAKLTAGTATLTIQVSGAAIPALSNISIGTTQASNAASTQNALGVGQSLAILLSNVSTDAANLSISIETART